MIRMQNRPTPIRMITPRHTAMACCLWAGLVLLVGWTASVSAEQGTLQAASDPSSGAVFLAWPGVGTDGPEVQLWTLDEKPKPGGSSDSPPRRWVELPSVPGRLATHGILAVDGSAVLFLEDGAVLQVTPLRTSNRPTLGRRVTSLRRLPEGLRLRATGHQGGRLWAWVYGKPNMLPSASERSATLLGNKEADDPELLRALGLPPGVRLSTSPPAATQPAETPSSPASTQPSTADPSDLAEEVEEAIAVDLPPRDMLLHLTGSAWQEADAPVDWLLEHNAPCWLVFADEGDPSPVLIRQPDRHTVLVSTPSSSSSSGDEASDPNGWSELELDLPEPGHLRAVASMEGLAVLAIEATDVAAPAIRVYVLHGGRLLAEPVDSPAAGDEDEDQLKGKRLLGQAVTLWSDAELAWIRMFRAGSEASSASDADEAEDPDHAKVKPVLSFETVLLDRTGQSRRLDVDPEPASSSPSTAGIVILSTVLGLATVLMLVSWRNQPFARGEVGPMLPENMAPADLGRRCIAGLIDLVPGIVGVAGWQGMSLVEISAAWPGNSPYADWSQIVPGAMAIAIILAHTTLGECLTGRSLGKALTGIRIVNLHGERLPTWRILIRGLLKAFDLVAPLLLALAVLTPTRQRLGDLVSGSLVVGPSVDPKPTDQDDRDPDSPS